jgi:protein-L-isoaspartate(D-aspartate) O-methyltransferase
MMLEDNIMLDAPQSAMKRFLAIIPLILLVNLTSPDTGVADDREREMTDKRLKMVDIQIRQRGVGDKRVLRAMETVERHRFVPPAAVDYAYRDTPLSIGHGQTISQPYIVALMTEVLQLRPEDRVLEIGTGSGYQAAVLAELVAEVYSIEIVPDLGHEAADRLARLGYDNVTVMVGDGYKGWPEHAPFDAVIVTAAPPKIPQALVDQLADGGRMVVPVGTHYQELIVIEKNDGKIEKRSVAAVRFVPMIHGEETGERPENE